MSKLLKLAEACLSGDYTNAKTAFCRTYADGVSTDPSLVDRGVYNRIVQTFLDEHPSHREMRDKAAYAIAAVVRLRPTWADRRVLDAIPIRRGWGANRLAEAFAEVRPDLIPSAPEASPAPPTSHPNTVRGHVAHL